MASSRGCPPARMAPRKPPKQQNTPACGLVRFMIRLVQFIGGELELKQNQSNFFLLCTIFIETLSHKKENRKHMQNTTEQNSSFIHIGKER